MKVIIVNHLLMLNMAVLKIIKTKGCRGSSVVKTGLPEDPSSSPSILVTWFIITQSSATLATEDPSHLTSARARTPYT